MQTGFKINEAGGFGYLTLSALEKIEGIRHGFTVKATGSKAVPPVAGPDFVSPQARQQFMEALRLTARHPAMVRQIHSDQILTINDDTDSSLLHRQVRADAIITNVSGLPIALLTADCLPLLLINMKARAVGIVHAGREGARLGLASKAVHAMKEAFGADPEETLAALGPAIGPCCYEVGHEVAEGFMEKYSWWEKVLRPGRDTRFYLDLFQANRIQLTEAGIPAANTIEPGLCTSCHPTLFHSYRRDGAIKGHIFSFLLLTDPPPKKTAS